MIIKESPTYLELIFYSQGSIIGDISGKIAFIFIYSCLIVLWQDANILQSDSIDYGIAFGPFAALTVSLSLFLGFRNNACYDRWWESRKQLGGQVVAVRNIARLITNLPDDGRDSVRDKMCEGRRRILSLVVAHIYATVWQLRDDDEAKRAMKSYVTDDDLEQLSSEPNVAETLLQMAVSQLMVLSKDHGWDSILIASVLSYVADLGNIHGSLERIRATPIPYTYTLLIHRTTWLYILLSPLAIVVDMLWLTPVFVSIMGYTFFGLNRLSCILMEPFSTNAMSQPLLALARNCEVAALRALGDPAPPLLTPDANGLIM